MIRHSRILVIGLILVLLALVTTAALVIASSPGVAPTIGGIGMIPTAHNPGTPALRPTIPGAVPAFTARDVTNFVNTRGTLWSTPGQVTVTSVDFLTAAQAAAKTGDTLDGGMEPSRPVCLVTVRGTLTVSGPPGGKVGVMSGAYLWFDAATGNILRQVAIN